MCRWSGGCDGRGQKGSTWIWTFPFVLLIFPTLNASYTGHIKYPCLLMVIQGPCIKARQVAFIGGGSPQQWPLNPNVREPFPREPAAARWELEQFLIGRALESRTPHTKAGVITENRAGPERGQRTHPTHVHSSASVLSCRMRMLCCKTL